MSDDPAEMARYVVLLSRLRGNPDFQEFEFLHSKFGARRGRGRPRTFTETQLAEAVAVKTAGKGNNAAAKILYKTKTPTLAQRRNVPKILKSLLSK